VSSDNPCIADNLTPSIRETSRTIDRCGNGFIAYEWFINITGVEEVICQGQVNFENQNIFTEANINWPANREALSCNNTAPIDSETSNLIPIIGNCNNVVASDPIDRVFDNVSGDCSRIIRTWTVVDWCRYPADPAARWTYEQTITVSSSMPPVINESATRADIVNDNANCRAEISATGVATDDCTNEEELIWSYTILQDGITIIPTSTGNTINTVLSMGNFEIQWRVEDDCGNTVTYTEAILIADTQAPQLTCASLDLPIDSTTQDAIITVVDFSSGSFDNCDAAFDMGIRRANSGDELAQLLRFDCQELGPIEVELVATDASGNTSSCKGFVNVTNANDACQFGASSIALAGQIITEANIPIEEVEVSMLDMSRSDVQVTMSDVNGQFEFQGMDSNEEYGLESMKIDDYRNGLSTADIIKIQNHILGLRDLDSPYKYLAADVNGSKSISALDLLLIRKIILQQIEEFPNEPSWKFVDQSVHFGLPHDIYNYNHSMGLVKGQEDIDMIGIKMGDVTADVL